ncbi:MAG: hypothetical protein EXR58_05065 [Chloroflexi bacterium]|nr:hypothetical protein [Chloroflexota bacterium]
MSYQPRTSLKRVLLPLVILPFLIACAPPSATRESTTGPGAVAGPPKVLHMGILGREPDNLLTASHHFIFHAALTKYDINGNPIPDLAVKLPTVNGDDWKVNPDGTMTVTWKLKSNTFWHDGTPLTAEDFVFGFKVDMDTRFSAAVRGELRSIGSLQAPDPKTLAVNWKFQTMGAGQSDVAGGIRPYPRHLMEPLYETGDIAALQNSPLWLGGWVGLGPFKLTSHTQGSFIDAAAFDQYFGGRPKIDRLVIKYMPDPNSMVAGVLSGDIDVIPGGSGIDIPQMLAIREQWGTTGGLTLAIPKGDRSVHLNFRDPSAPWVKDVRVRQAMVHALDRNEIDQALQSGLLGTADWYIEKNTPVYDLAVKANLPKYPYDPARASQLLAEAGWTRAPGAQLRNAAGEILAHHTVADAGSGANILEITTMSSMWSAVGIFSEPKGMAKNVDLPTQYGEGYHGTMVRAWNFAGGLAPQYIGITSARIPSADNKFVGNNHGAYVNPAIDDLYNQMTRTLVINDVQQAALGIARIIGQEVPIFPLYYQGDMHVSAAAVKGPGMVPAVQRYSTWNIMDWDLQR